MHLMIENAKLDILEEWAFTRTNSLLEHSWHCFQVMLKTTLKGYAGNLSDIAEKTCQRDIAYSS